MAITRFALPTPGNKYIGKLEPNQVQIVGKLEPNQGQIVGKLEPNQGQIVAILFIYIFPGVGSRNVRFCIENVGLCTKMFGFVCKMLNFAEPAL